MRQSRIWTPLARDHGFYAAPRAAVTALGPPVATLPQTLGRSYNSTLYRRQFSFMYWLCTKQNFLLCAYECDFDDNDTLTIV
jgi:hypothetical protein